MTTIQANLAVADRLIRAFRVALGIIIFLLLLPLVWAVDVRADPCDPSDIRNDRSTEAQQVHVGYNSVWKNEGGWSTAPGRVRFEVGHCVQKVTLRFHTGLGKEATLVPSQFVKVYPPTFRIPSSGIVSDIRIGALSTLTTEQPFDEVVYEPIATIEVNISNMVNGERLRRRIGVDYAVPNPKPPQASRQSHEETEGGAGIDAEGEGATAQSSSVVKDAEGRITLTFDITSSYPSLQDGWTVILRGTGIGGSSPPPHRTAPAVIRHVGKKSEFTACLTEATEAQRVLVGFHHSSQGTITFGEELSVELDPCAAEEPPPASWDTGSLVHKFWAKSERFDAREFSYYALPNDLAFVPSRKEWMTKVTLTCKAGTGTTCDDPANATEAYEFGVRCGSEEHLLTTTDGKRIESLDAGASHAYTYEAGESEFVWPRRCQAFSSAPFELTIETRKVGALHPQ